MPLSLLPGGRKKVEESAENFDHSRLAVPGVISLVIVWHKIEWGLAPAKWEFSKQSNPIGWWFWWLLLHT